MDGSSSGEVRMMTRFLTTSGRRAQLLGGAVLAAVLALGCGGSRSEFIGARVMDTCDAAWPVCGTMAGCILGPESYTEGRFPGRGRFIVQVPEASTVRVRFFLEDVVAAGEETVVTFHEEGCRARTRQAITGRAALELVEKQGELSREADLTGVGDHLIELSSDMQARYVMKVEVVPLRNR
ncbi:MAG TPA: hypothetical protein VK458_00800 [Myxococcaceae bacterium]|nr:hypothetical protein [Myxococcaceae bacterium]